MKKISIIGHFAYGKDCVNGQTIKTKILSEEIGKKKNASIRCIDTYNWQHRPINLLFDILKGMGNSSELLVLLSRNGMKVIFPILYYLKVFYKIKIHHVVIGGCLDELICKNKSWIKYLNSFEGNYIESNVMAEKIKCLGINNAFYLPNFKKVNILETIDEKDIKSPFKLCTFSRVTKKKGIEIAISAVIEANEKGEKEYSLDIYGPIEENYKEEFEKLILDSPDFISYKGIVDFNNTSKVLKKYYMLLFPTYFDGEGFPGTIIDAFSSGVPIIASDWHFNKEIVESGKTGYIVPVNNIQSIVDVLVQADCEKIIEMKKNCLKKAKYYTPEVALEPLLKQVFIEEQ